MAAGYLTAATSKDVVCGNGRDEVIHQLAYFFHEAHSGPSFQRSDQPLSGRAPASGSRR